MPDDDKSFSGLTRQVMDQLFPQPAPAQVGGNFGTMTPQEAATARTPGTVLDAIVSEAAGLPQRAFEASENLRQGGDYDPAPAVEVASLLTGIGAPLAEEGAAGIFGGKLARTADQAALQRAVAMDRQGLTAEDIFKETGWFRGWDGQWRFEISDKPMTVIRGSGQASDLISHPELFAAYPDLAKIKTDIGRLKIGEDSKFGGEFRPSVNKMAIWGPDDPLRQITAHELQHGVQHLEGFEQGTNMNVAGKEGYHRTAGEVEARNTERRVDLGPKTRRKLLPWETQDVPFSEQLPAPRLAAAAKSEGEGTVRKIQKPGRWPIYEATRRGETKQFKDPEQARRWATSPPVQRPDPVADILERPPWE